MGLFFILGGGVDLSRHHVNILFLQLEYMKWLKNGAGRGFTFYAVIPALYPI